MNSDNTEENPEELELLLRQYEEHLKQETVPYWEQESFLMVIDYYDDELEFDKALQITEEAIEQHRYSAPLYIRKAQLLTEKNQLGEAFEFLEKATLFEPTNIEIYLTKCDLYMRQNDQRKALEILNEARYIADDEDLPDLYVLKATIYEIQENHKNAMKFLKKALEKAPKNTLALNRLWIAIDTLGDYAASIEYHLEFIDQHPYSYWAWYNLGLSYNAVGLKEKAAEAFDFSITINEQFEPAYHDYIVTLLELERCNEALRYLEEYKSLFEPDAEIWFRLGRCYEWKEKYEESKNFYHKALQIDNLGGDVHYHLGNCYVAEQQWKEAIVAYKQAYEADNKNEQFSLALADAYDANGNSPMAQKYYQKAIETAPAEAIVWIHYIEFLIDEEAYEVALEMLTEARQYTQDLILDCVQAAILIESGNRKAGFVVLGNILKEDENMIDHFFEIAPMLENDSEVLLFIKQHH